MVLGSKSNTCSCGFSDDSDIPWAELGGSKISAIVEYAAVQFPPLRGFGVKLGVDNYGLYNFALSTSNSQPS